jgi:hypothetical protein
MVKLKGGTPSLTEDVKACDEARSRRSHILEVPASAMVAERLLLDEVIGLVVAGEKMQQQSGALPIRQ